MTIITKENLRRKNFVPNDFFYSVRAERLKINNDTDDLNILTCLVVTADKIQQVRDLLNHPITITSGYRCRELNKEVKGKPNSQHLQGQAVDFISPTFGTPTEIVKFLKDNKVEVDQCLIENNSWVHLSIKHNGNRNQFAEIENDNFVSL